MMAPFLNVLGLDLKVEVLKLKSQHVILEFL
jgi:hypothetical protein